MDDIDRHWDKIIGDRVRLRELRILHAVARHGSMAKAAAALSMTQPAVSQAIGLLEAALGAPMLHRSPAGVTLTEFGEAMLHRAMHALDALTEGVREVALLADPAGGEIVVGASESYIAGGVLAKTMLDLIRQFPRIRLHVTESNTAGMDFDDLRQRRVDIMLGRAATTRVPEDLVAHKLLDEKLVVVAGRHNQWAADPTITFADLGTKPWVLAPPGTAVYELVSRQFQATDLPMPTVPVTTYSMLLRLQLLTTGPYVTAFPESLVQNNATRWDLQVLPLTLGTPLPVAAFTLKSRTQNRAIQSFIAAAREQSRPEN